MGGWFKDKIGKGEGTICAVVIIFSYDYFICGTYAEVTAHHVQIHLSINSFYNKTNYT